MARVPENGPVPWVPFLYLRFLTFPQSKIRFCLRRRFRRGRVPTGSESATPIASGSAIQNHGKRLAFDNAQRQDLRVMLQPGQLVRVNLAGLQAEGVMFQAAVTDAVGHIVKQTSEQPPKYLVKLLFSFRGVTEVEVPADRIHADKKME